MRLHVLPLVLLTASLALAQQPAIVSPAAGATGLGNANNNIPFSWQPTAYQQVHSATSFSAAGPAIIGLMRFRMASGFAGRAGNSIDVELFMADSPNDASNASSVFASNVITGTEANVFVRKMVNLPTVPNNDWAIMFPFDNQFGWTGGHLSWRADVWGNGNGNALFVYPIDAFAGRGSYSQTGTTAGCQSAFGTRAATHTSSMNAPGQVSTFYGNSYDPAGGVPSSLNLGFSSTSAGGLPLPFDLAPLGAAGCFIINDIVATVPNVTVAGTNGRSTDTISVPNTPRLAGAIVLTQYMFLSPGANALGLYTSNGITNVIGIPPEVTRIYASGSPGATAGTVGSQFGMTIGLN